MDKIVDARYDENTGVSVVTLGTKWGTFTHAVRLSEEDKDIANRWDGCKFAHYLCMIDKLKSKGHAFIERANGINHAATAVARAMYDGGVSRVENPREFNKVLGKMRDQAYYAERDGRKYLEVAESMKQKYPEFVEETLKARRKFQKKEQ